MSDIGAAAYRKTVSTVFWILCLFPVLTVLAASSASAYAFISVFLRGDEDVLSTLTYIFTFVVPQTIYPILTVVSAFFMLRLAGKRAKGFITAGDINAVDMLLCLSIFLGMSVATSYLSQYFTDFLISIGVPVPDLSEFLSVPDGALETCLFLFVISVLPAFCEEFVFRGVIAGLLGQYNKTAAIILSALAFGLMHGTVQQIPFAFLVGLFLAYVYLKFNALLPCIILHFANNLISCIFTILYEMLPEDVYGTVPGIFDISMVVLGVASSVFFIIRRVKERKKPDMSEEPNMSEETDGQKITGGKAAVASLLSPALLVYVVIAVLYTAFNIMIGSLL